MLIILVVDGFQTDKTFPIRLSLNLSRALGWVRTTAPNGGYLTLTAPSGGLPKATAFGRGRLLRT